MSKLLRNFLVPRQHWGRFVSGCRNFSTCRETSADKYFTSKDGSMHTSTWCTLSDLFQDSPRCRDDHISTNHCFSDLARNVFKKTLDQILLHPIFWLVEQKFTNIIYSDTWMQNPKNPRYTHGLPNIKGMLRTLDPTIFKKNFANSSFYDKSYLVIPGEFSEFSVQEIPVIKDWNLEYQGAFDLGYSKFGKGTSKEDTNANSLKFALIWKCITQTRIL